MGNRKVASPIAPDDELKMDVVEALWNDDLLRRVDLPFVRVTVQDGIVTLEGNVVTGIHRLRAEEIVRKVPGVLDVQNHLIGDEELEIAVAQALGRDERTRRQLIRVRAVQGIVRLAGEVTAAAEEVAAHVPGVREVVVGAATGESG
jgi:osmotically-inducible protein OsmY